MTGMSHTFSEGIAYGKVKGEIIREIRTLDDPTPGAALLRIVSLETGEVEVAVWLTLKRSHRPDIARIHIGGQLELPK